MTTTEQIADLLLKGEEQGWLSREEVDELARDLPPVPREALLRRIAIHGIEVREDAESADPVSLAG